MRIIAGRWRRRMLAVPDEPGLRPTPDRVRETLFNWLAEDLPGARCLDLFAGSGALGLEAASRGAVRVVLVERSPQVARHLESLVRLLGGNPDDVSVVCRDAASWLRRSDETFDVVFVDPPYGSVDLPGLLQELVEGGHLAPHGRVFVECAANEVQAVIPETWRVLRDQRAGRVRYYLATPGPDESHPPAGRSTRPSPDTV